RFAGVRSIRFAEVGSVASDRPIFNRSAGAAIFICAGKRAPHLRRKNDRKLNCHSTAIHRPLTRRRCQVIADHVAYVAASSSDCSCDGSPSSLMIGNQVESKAGCTDVTVRLRADMNTTNKLSYVTNKLTN
ncbi:hypothetical protein THAOC_13268, partial [Thalassiosira oceanica]